MSAEPAATASTPRDSLDLPALRDGTRRAIAWDTPAPPLDPERRARLVHAWSWRREQEHYAVGTFCELAQLSLEQGLDPAVLALLTRAATDEVHHADVCRRYVELVSGERQPLVLRGAHRRREGPAPREHDLLFRLVETACLSETLTGAYFTDMLEIATWPTARAVILSLLEDEIDHGRLGWAALAAALRDGPAGLATAVAEELPRLLDRTVREVFEQAEATPEADDPGLDPYGYMGRTRAAAVYRDALRAVVLPGFEAAGVETGAARTWLAARGWA